MRIAVTGGTGFLGKSIVTALAGLGHQVVLLTRRPERVSPPFEGRAFDAMSSGATDALEGCDAVVHLAGEPVIGRFTQEHRERVLESRKRGTRAIAQAAAATGTVRIIVSASGIGYYGTRGDAWLTEESAAGDDFLARVCVAWEEALAPAEAAGIRTVKLRIGNVLHPEGGRLAAILPVFRMGVGAPLGSGQQFVSWIHRDDLVDLFLHALAHDGLLGVVNAVAPNPVTEREFAKALGAALHRPVLFRVPAFALKLALGELSEVVLASQRCSGQKALQHGFQFRYTTLDAALDSFNL